jgi:hypothetical protein
LLLLLLAGSDVASTLVRSGWQPIGRPFRIPG